MLNEERRQNWIALTTLQSWLSECIFMQRAWEKLKNEEAELKKMLVSLWHNWMTQFIVLCDFWKWWPASLLKQTMKITTNYDLLSCYSCQTHLKPFQYLYLWAFSFHTQSDACWWAGIWAAGCAEDNCAAWVSNKGIQIDWYFALENSKSSVSR